MKQNVFLMAVLATLGSAVPVLAQNQTAAPSVAGPGTEAVTLAALPPASARKPGVGSASLAADSDDPIDDRGLFETLGAAVGGVWTWIGYTSGSLFSAVTPPTPESMARDWQDNNQKSTFFTMIGDAGYKIKEIENGVGLPPTITVKFGRIRNLSDADIDYLDRAIRRWAKKEPGMVGDAQRAAISTLVAINQSDSYVVDTVSMRLLPLPQFKFSLAPTTGGLGWESSQLMRAIQRLDRRVTEAQGK